MLFRYKGSFNRLYAIDAKLHRVRTISISLFMTADRMAIDPTVKSDGFLSNHGSDSYGAWCGGCQGPSVHDARESSVTEPSK